MLQLACFCECRLDFLPEGDALDMDSILWKVADVAVFWFDDFPVIRLENAANAFHQGGFAGAIVAGEGDAFLRVHGKREVFENDSRTELNVKILDGQHCAVGFCQNHRDRQWKFHHSLRVVISGLSSDDFAMENNVTCKLIDLALTEDIRDGDVTSLYFVPEDQESSAYIHAKAEGVLAGMEVAEEVFRRVDASLDVRVLKRDGDRVNYGDKVLEVSGASRSILTAERTALNFLQRLSGIATNTSRYVALASGTEAKVLDTRKTTPGWRQLEKDAVVAGGGSNHRMGLYDRAMVKDNHLAAQDGLAELQEAIDLLKKEKPGVEVELETETLEQVEKFLTLNGVDYILLDNMDNDSMREAVRMRGGSGPALEASGGVNLDTIKEIAETGVDFISVGALTHSAVALDLSLEFLDKDC